MKVLFRSYSHLSCCNFIPSSSTFVRHDMSMIWVSLQPTFIFLRPLQRPHSPSPLRPCNSWKKQNRHSLDATATKAFHPRTGLPLLSSPVRNAHTHLHTLLQSQSHHLHLQICAFIIINKLTLTLTDSATIDVCAVVCVITTHSPPFISSHLKHYSQILHQCSQWTLNAISRCWNTWQGFLSLWLGYRVCFPQLMYR